jgi:hypothetical protein
MRGAIPPLSITPSRRGAQLRYRNNFTFTLICIFTFTLHIRRPSPPSTTRGRAMPWWQGPHNVGYKCNKYFNIALHTPCVPLNIKYVQKYSSRISRLREVSIYIRIVRNVDTSDEVRYEPRVTKDYYGPVSETLAPFFFFFFSKLNTFGDETWPPHNSFA